MNMMTTIYTEYTYLVLTLFLSASLFFLMAGIRELKDYCLEGLLYLTIFFFFGIAHYLFLINLPISSQMSFQFAQITFWQWLIILFAPSLIILFLLIGIFNFFVEQFQAGLIKIYFGLTLLCFLYMLGTSWAPDIKGIITLLFCLIWFEVELRTAH